MSNDAPSFTSLFRLPEGVEVEVVYFRGPSGELIIRTVAELEILGPPEGAERIEIPRSP